MAGKDGNVVLSLERLIHDSMWDVMQATCDNYGVKIDSIAIDWMELSTPRGTEFKIRGVCITSTTSSPASPAD